MKIAMDGGAFQQGIAAGILNVAVGLINGMVAERPDLQLVLVTDPRLGTARPDLVARLDVVPEIVEAAVGPAYAERPRGLLTSDPAIHFEVDGLLIPATPAGEDLAYEGPPPRTSFRIVSRAASPAVTLGSSDTRVLGIAMQSLVIEGGDHFRTVNFDDPDLVQGFHPAEPNQRWTDGCGTVPAELFPSAADSVRVTLGVAPPITYQLSDGLFDEALDRSTRAASALRTRIETLRLERRLAASGVDVFIANHFIPIRFSTIRSCAILYDLIPILFPHYFMSDAQENFDHNVSVFEAADHVFSISEASRADLVRLTRASPSRVTAIGIDIGDEFGAGPAEPSLAQVEARHGLPGRRFVLSVGTLEPRKNHSRLIEAFATVGDDVPDCDLVIVGKPGWGTGDVYESARRSGLGDRILFLDTVTNAELATLYRAAVMLAYPSVYEGFGLPVLEAMACGCPVLTSNTSSMPEIAGDAAILVDPTDVGSIADGLRLMLSNASLRRDLAAKGLRQRTAFDWRASARSTLAVLDRRP